MKHSLKKEAKLGDLGSVERGPDSTSSHDPTGSPTIHPEKYTTGKTGLLARWNAKIEGLAGVEARGIARVEPDERQRDSWSGYFQIALLWFSVDVTANNLALGFLGPLVYGLGFTDSACCAVFGGILGSMAVSYIVAWGPRSGNRTMIMARYWMGYYPSKLACLLNIVSYTQYPYNNND